jgi:predicted DsbA family dithiol-disulfide isomerase
MLANPNFSSQNAITECRVLQEIVIETGLDAIRIKGWFMSLRVEYCVASLDGSTHRLNLKLLK